MSGGTGTSPLRPLSISDRQAQRKFGHDSDFGVLGPYNRLNAERFKAALITHVVDPAIQTIQGTYGRGTAPGGFPALFYLNPSTRLIVVTDLSGNFVTGFQLSPQQLWHVQTIGKLGGGA